MAVTKTSLLNKALVQLGASTITDITDDTANARSLNAVYEISLTAILNECGWNFATTRSSLVTSSVTQPWSYINESFVYDRPTDIVRILSASDKDAVYREEGDYIMSDTQDLGLKYVYYHDTPSKYPGLFLEAFIDKLSADICLMILNSATKAKEFKLSYMEVSLPAAMAVNSQTGTQQSPNDDEWERAKYGNEGNPAKSYE